MRATSDEKMRGADAENAPEDRDSQKTRKRDTSGRAIVRLTERLNFRLFHTPGKVAFASFFVKDHWETYRVKSSSFKELLCTLCFRGAGFVPNQNSLADALSTLSGNALYRGPEEQVHTRLAEHDGAVYLDLGNDAWEVVRITTEGWEVISAAPVKFVRSPDMLALPYPIDGGNFDLLRPVLNLDDDNLILAVGWLVGALQPRGPFPVLVLEGTHGSAKSTAARFLLSLVDPRKAQIRGAPRTAHELSISAANSWCLGFDNLSEIRPWLSDALCRLSTGSGFSTRAYYTDDEEKIFEGIRPVLLNGIAIGVDREDLRDRCIFLSLPPIENSRRMTVAEVSTRFREIQPYVLGCLLDAVSCALRRSAEIKPGNLPRMADFVTWVSAAEPALGWSESSFCEAYSRNRIESNAIALESSQLYHPIARIADQGSWEGTATELYDKVWCEGPTYGDSTKQLPSSVKVLSQALRRLAPNLRQEGIRVEIFRTAGNGSKRMIRIRRLAIDATEEALEGAAEK
jgi:putative DNA primase/helicase